MAGDWIPMRTNLRDDPTVVFIARATKLLPDHVVGKLHHFWAWADSNTTDGIIADIDGNWIDQYIGKPGFAAAMAAARTPWLRIHADGIELPNFEHWFGASAKRRLNDTKRKQFVRSLSATCPQNGRTKTALQDRTGQNIITTTLDDDDFQWIADKARTITAKLGKAGTARNRRLILGCCAIVRAGIEESWLDNGVRATDEKKAAKPYAYLQTVLAGNADRLGFDLVASVDAFNITAIPKTKEPIPCQ